jgi:phosphatidate cytidylyltransferase
MVFAGLYAFLTLSSALVWRLEQQQDLRLQIFAWWRIFPIVTLAVLFFPLGFSVLFYLLLWLIWRELRQYAANAQQFAIYCAGSLMFYSAVLMLPAHWQLPLQLLGFGLVAVGYRTLIRRQKVTMACWLLALTGLGCLLTTPHWLGYNTALADTVLVTAAQGAELVHLKLVVMLFVLTALNDVAQFIAGKLFGRHFLAATLSPNKTWQGAFGGVVVSVILALVIGNYWQLAANSWLVGIGITLAIAGIIGDLCLSYAKRKLSIKDFSQLIPGHGGILDRVDSLIFTTPVMVLWAQFAFGVV